MNYQTSALWFYKPLPFLALLLSLIFAYLGFSAGLGYLMLMGIVLPIVMAIYLHRQKENQVVWSPQKNSDWLVYVNGIPVYEQRNILTNPGFSSQASARRFFLSGFAIKLFVQLACLWQVIWQFYTTPYNLLSAIAGSVVLVALLYVTRHTGQHLLALRHLQYAGVQQADGAVWH